MGADAVLLIVAALTDAGARRRFVDLARALSLTALVEVHDEIELAAGPRRRRRPDRGQPAGPAHLRGGPRRALDLGRADPRRRGGGGRVGHPWTPMTSGALADGRLPGRAGGGDPGPVGRPSGRGGRSPRSRAGEPPYDADERSRLFVKICGITSEADALLAVGMGAVGGRLRLRPVAPPDGPGRGGRHRQAPSPRDGHRRACSATRRLSG